MFVQWAVTKSWTEDKTQLQIGTLRAILMVKCKLPCSRLEFYKFLKPKPQLLRKVGGKNKYNKKTIGVVK